MPNIYRIKKPSKERLTAYERIRKKADQGLPLESAELDIFMNPGREIESSYDFPERKRIIQKISEIDTSDD